MVRWSGAAVIASCFLGLTLPGIARPTDDGKLQEDLIKGSDKGTVVKALQDYLAAADDEKKQVELYSDLEKKLEKATKPSGIDAVLKHPDYLGRLIQESLSKNAKVFKGHPIPKQKSELKYLGKKYEAEFTYCVPKDYDSRLAYPLILALPPSGTSGEKYINDAWKDEGARDKYVILAPTPSAGESWFSETGRLKALALVLRRALDDFNIDMDRIFLDGTAEAGEDALKLASAYADILAGVIVRSGNPIGIAAVNFRNLPLIIAHSKDDPKVQKDALQKFVDQLHALKYDVTVETVAGREHGACGEATAAVVGWMENRRRLVSVPEIQWSVPDQQFGRAYWLQIVRMETGKDVTADFSAKADKTKNRIDISSKNVYEFRVMLNDEIIDLDRPIEVYINGQQVFNGKKERALRHCLDQYHRSGDPARAFTASLQINVPG